MPDVEGVLSYTDIMTSPRLADYARRLEALGYQELWVPDLMGRETFVTAGFLLANTTRIRGAMSKVPRGGTPRNAHRPSGARRGRW